MAKDGIVPFHLTTWNCMQEQNQRGCFWYISCTTMNFSDDLCTPLNPRTPCHHSPSFTLTFRLHPFPSISLKKKHATLLTKSTTSYYNLHQPSPKIASHLHIFLGRLELNHDPLWSHQGRWLHRSIASSKVLLDGSTTNGQQLVPHTEPLLFGPRAFFFGGGQRFPNDFRKKK